MLAVSRQVHFSLGIAGESLFQHANSHSQRNFAQLWAQHAEDGFNEPDLISLAYLLLQYMCIAFQLDIRIVLAHSLISDNLFDRQTYSDLL